MTTTTIRILTKLQHLILYLVRLSALWTSVLSSRSLQSHNHKMKPTYSSTINTNFHYVYLRLSNNCWYIYSMITYCSFPIFTLMLSLLIINFFFALTSIFNLVVVQYKYCILNNKKITIPIQIIIKRS